MIYIYRVCFNSMHKFIIFFDETKRTHKNTYTRTKKNFVKTCLSGSLSLKTYKSFENRKSAKIPVFDKILPSVMMKVKRNG